MSNSIWNPNFCQTAAAKKSISFYFLYFFWNLQCSQAAAARKRSTSYLRHTFWKCHISSSFAASKSSLSYFYYSVLYRYPFQFLTIMKSIIPDGSCSCPPYRIFPAYPLWTHYKFCPCFIKQYTDFGCIILTGRLCSNQHKIWAIIKCIHIDFCNTSRYHSLFQIFAIKK